MRMNQKMYHRLHKAFESRYAELSELGISLGAIKRQAVILKGNPYLTTGEEIACYQVQEDLGHMLNQKGGEE